MTWLRRFRRADPGAPRVVCFPHSGGGATTFLALARELAPAGEVVAVQYPGRQDRRGEPPVTDLGSPEVSCNDGSVSPNGARSA